MSWDISIQNLPRDVKTVAEIPDDYQPQPIGPRDQLIARILEVLPDIDFSDPTWGMLDSGDYSIEFNIGSERICEHFMLHVRGGGDAMRTVARLLDHLQLRGFDCQTGDFFSIEEAKRSFGEWQAFRNRVVGGVDGGPLG
jgi:hypothetical protein